MNNELTLVISSEAVAVKKEMSDILFTFLDKELSKLTNNNEIMNLVTTTDAIVGSLVSEFFIKIFVIVKGEQKDLEESKEKYIKNLLSLMDKNLEQFIQTNREAICKVSPNFFGDLKKND